MATDKDFINYLEEKISHIPGTRTRAMFGEYAYYCDNVVIGLVCDNTVYIKITPETEKILGTDAEKGPPYPGAKDQYILDDRTLDDQELMKKLVVGCAKDVTASKDKKKPSKKKS
jgi:TfoX/Sxy family transcriptional regulator of competence genes